MAMSDTSSQHSCGRYKLLTKDRAGREYFVGIDIKTGKITEACMRETGQSPNENESGFTVASGGSTPVYMTPGTQLDRETVDALSGIIASSCQQHRDLRKEEQARSQKDREANYWEDRVEEWRLTGTLLVGLTVCASLITVATDRSNNSLRREIKELRSEMKDMNAVPTVTCEVGAGSQSEQPDGTLIRVDLADSYADKDDAKDDSNGVCSAFAFIPFEEA